MRSRVAAMVAMAATGFVLSCSQHGSVPAESRDRVRVAALPFLSLMPFHIAQEEGYFADQQLDVEFLALGRNQDVMTAVAQGEVDAMAGMLTLNELSLIAAGARIRAVAALTEPPPAGATCTPVAVMVRRDHLDDGSLADRERIRRMRFDINPFIPLGFALDTLLRTAGLTLDDVDTVDLIPPVALDALPKGQIDATVDSEPYLSMLMASDKAVVWRSVYDLIPGYVHSVVIFGPTLLDERPGVGERFMAAVLKAMRQYRLGKTPRNLDIVTRASGLTAQQVSGACWPTPAEDGRLDAAAFQAYQEWSVGRSLLTRVLTPAELIDGRFIEHANAELGR